MPRATQPRRKREGRGKFVPRRRVCPFCADKSLRIDYKDPGKLRRFVSDRGKIEPRRRSGACARHQRQVALAIKRARFLALLPHTAEHIRKGSGAAEPQEPIRKSSGAAEPAEPIRKGSGAAEPQE